MERWLNELDHAITSMAIRLHSSEGPRRASRSAAAEVMVEEVEGTRVLHLEILPAAALPARGLDGVAAAGVEAAVGEAGSVKSVKSAMRVRR